MNAGKCESCNYTGPLFEFKNDLADPPIRYNLCPNCMRKAYTCVALFIRTPNGRKALAAKQAKQK